MPSLHRIRTRESVARVGKAPSRILRGVRCTTPPPLPICPTLFIPPPKAPCSWEKHAKAAEARITALGSQGERRSRLQRMRGCAERPQPRSTDRTPPSLCVTMPAAADETPRRSHHPLEEAEQLDSRFCSKQDSKWGWNDESSGIVVLPHFHTTAAAVVL